MPQDIKTKIDKLREQINFHAHRYYVLDDPLIADSEYDQLFQELLKLEEMHPEAGSKGRHNREQSQQEKHNSCGYEEHLFNHSPVSASCAQELT